MSPAALVAVATALVLGGLLLAVAGVVGMHRPASPPRGAVSHVAALFVTGMPARQRRRRRRLLAAAVAAIVVVWLLTGWPVAGLTGGLAVVGVPWLFRTGRAEREAITTLEAVAAWTRRLRDLVQAGHGLVSAIVTSARGAPAPIAAEVTALAAALQAGADPQQALDVFADRLAGFTSDEAVAALKLHASDRGQRLAELLGDVADDATGQALSRRGIAAKRAEPRFVTQTMTVLILVVLAAVFSDRQYAATYGTPLGETVLAAVLLALIGLLAWIRHLSRPPAAERFLPTVAENHTGVDGSVQ